MRSEQSILSHIDPFDVVDVYLTSKVIFLQMYALDYKMDLANEGSIKPAKVIQNLTQIVAKIPFYKC